MTDQSKQESFFARNQSSTPSGSETGGGEATPTAMSKAELVKAQHREDGNSTALDKLKDVLDLDWKKLPPPILAKMISQIPFKGASGEPDYFLSPVQSMIFAMRSFELGLSPFSNEIWFNPKNNKANVTFEGKLKLAHDRGMNFGPPKFERVSRRNPAYPKTMPQLAGPGEEPGIKCSMSVCLSADGFRETAEYTAWMTEWYMSRSPVWREKPEHMLQLRAAEKCISFAFGTGASELPGDADIDESRSTVPIEPPKDKPNFDVVEFTNKEER